MKKWIALILALILCLPLCACSADPERAVVGEWNSYLVTKGSSETDVDPDFAVLVINKDGTGTFSMSDTVELTWTLRSEDSIETDGKTIPLWYFTIHMEKYGKETLVFSPGEDGILTFGSYKIYLEKD